MPLAAAEISSGNLAGVLKIRRLSRDLRRQYLQATYNTKQRTLNIQSIDLENFGKSS
jgi:hypothetical protein